MSNDVEKTRVEYVTELEHRVNHLQQQLEKYKPLAEHWMPVVEGRVESDDSVSITLAFAGKRVTATIGKATISQNTIHDLTNGVANTLAESMLVSEISKVVQPEVIRLVEGAKLVAKAGKW